MVGRSCRCARGRAGHHGPCGTGEPSRSSGSTTCPGNVVAGGREAAAVTRERALGSRVSWICSTRKTARRRRAERGGGGRELAAAGGIPAVGGHAARGGPAAGTVGPGGRRPGGQR